MIVECAIGTPQSAGEIFGRDRTKLESGCSTGRRAGFVNINHGVRKAADPRDDRDGAVSVTSNQ